MDFEGIENFTEEQIMQMYNDVLEGSSNSSDNVIDDYTIKTWGQISRGYGGSTTNAWTYNV